MSNLSLEKLVQERSYSYLENNYVPSEFALQFINFIKLVNGGSEENKSSVIHLDMLDAVSKYNNVLIVSFRGSAKALPLYTPLLTDSGSKLMKDIKHGDIIIDRDGNRTKVVHTSRVMYRPIYRLYLEDNNFIDVSVDHINIVRDSTGNEYNLTTKELIESNKDWYIPLVKPIKYDYMSNDYKYTNSYNKRTILERMIRNHKLILQDNGVICNNLNTTNITSNIIRSMGKMCITDYNNLTVKLVDKDSVKITDIKYLYNDYCKCIEVDSDTNSFVTSNYVVTHNTTVMAEYMILYIGAFGKLPNHGSVDVGIYVGDTIDNGVKSLRNNLEHRYLQSEFLKKVIPETNFTDVKWEFVNAEGHRTTFKGYGANSGIRGVKEYGKRPTFAILDDLLSDKNATSNTIIADIENTIYNAVRQALHPNKRKIVWIGTPFNKKDPLYKAAGSKAWETRVYPICEKFPCPKEEFKGAWEDRFSYEAISREYTVLKEAGKVDAFNQELMLRILSDDDRLVLDSDICWYNDRNNILNNKHNYSWYITTDFAVSENQKADYSVLSVWALSYENKWYLVDGVLARQDINTTIDNLFNFVAVYNPYSVAIEVSGQQQGFVQIIKKEMDIRNTWFNLASDKNTHSEGIRPNTNKLVRFNSVLPLFKQKKIYLPKELEHSPIIVEALDELQSVTPSGFKSKHDDFCDTVSQIPLLTVIKPEKPITVNSNDDNVIYRNVYLNTDNVVEFNNSYIV